MGGTWGHKEDMVGVSVSVIQVRFECSSSIKTFAICSPAVFVLLFGCVIFQTQCTIGGKESVVWNTVPTNSSLPNWSKTSGPFLQNSKSNFGSLIMLTFSSQLCSPFSSLHRSTCDTVVHAPFSSQFKAKVTAIL